MKMTVDLKEHSYPIYIERGILKEAAERIAEVYRGSKIMIISDDRVYSYYGEALKKNLSEKYECTETVIPHGEPSKAFETLPGVYSSLLKAKISRTDLIVALGGGVVGDLAGFVAATFLRGIKFVQIPTSILAQVDSSVGGKVAVDLPQGKNLVGAFYQPKMVLIDPDVLETLPERYVTDGMGEVIKYGCIKDEKFSKKMMDYILFKNIDGKYLTLEDCIKENKKEEAPAENTEEKAENTENTENTENADEKKEPEKTTVYYVTDEVQQSQYINMFRSQGMDAVILKHNIDSAFITHAERYNEHVTFQRIDADLTNDMKDESGEDLTDATNTLTDLFRKVLDKKDLTVKVENLKDENVSSMVTLSEESRRMQDMMKMYNMYGMDPSMFGGAGETLVLNANNKLVQYVLNHGDGENTNKICEQLYVLALLAHGSLSPERMTGFVARTNEIMMMLAEK